MANFHIAKMEVCYHRRLAQKFESRMIGSEKESMYQL